MNSVAINMGVKVSLQCADFCFLAYKSSSEVADLVALELYI